MISTKPRPATAFPTSLTGSAPGTAHDHRARGGWSGPVDRDRVIEAGQTLSTQPRRSLARDCGNEMTRIARLTAVAAQPDGRLRQTPGWLTSVQSLNHLLSERSFDVTNS